jgi:hypothetical protein
MRANSIEQKIARLKHKWQVCTEAYLDCGFEEWSRIIATRSPKQGVVGRVIRSAGGVGMR